MSPGSRSRAARIESEGYPRQRAVSCIQSKPPKRQVKVIQEEKNKSRLRLVVAQIQVGNTNPKLIQEANILKKDLYDIDGAYMMLKR